MPGPLLPIALGVGAIGSVLKARSQSKQISEQRRQFDELQGLLKGFLNDGSQGSPIETALFSSAGGYGGAGGGIPDLSYLTSASDPILQAIRRGPNQSFISENLMGIASTGDPFDTSNILESLAPIRARARDEAIATSRAAAPGLGSRFGTAQRNAENDLLAELEQNNAALDAQIVMGGYEAAQGRRMQALQQLVGLEENDRLRQTSALEAMLQRAGIQLQAGNLGLAERSRRDSALSVLLNASLNRRGQNLQGIAALGGVQVPGGSPYGDAAVDIGQLLILSQLLGGGQGGDAGAGISI